MIKAILLDIEGTTTPIEFVHRVLFPYAEKHIHDFLVERYEALEIRNLVSGLYREYQHEMEAGVPQWISPEDMEGAVAYLRWLMFRDRKSTGLKAIQGLIWELGFQCGELRGEVFGDVPAAFERCKSGGKRLFIFSSGSVLAQKLVFRSSNAGDLTPYLSGYFDTETGPKRESASYSKISALIGLEPSEVLFISDVPEELSAAETSGMQALLAVRPGNRPAEGTGFQVVESFDYI